MGLMDFLKSELIDVITWLEEDKDTMIWKFPDSDQNIKYGAQLTVRESQEALFLDKGKFADHYQPGMYALTTDNMPILTTLKSWKYGFDSPFKCDVYYASTKQFGGLKWGTPSPVIMRDPEFKQVRVKAFGSYFIKIVDAKKFFTEFAGTSALVKVAEVEEKMRDLISPKFAEAAAEAGVAVLDLVAQTTEIGERIKPLIQDEFTPFGLELTKFQITSISLPEEVEKFYDKMTNMNMVGNMAQFTQFQVANAIEANAEKPGHPNPMMDMGTGMVTANMMMQQMQQMNQQQQAMQNQGANATTPNAATPNAAVQTKEQILAMLKELGALKEVGILTAEEFDAKKAELLAKL